MENEYPAIAISKSNYRKVRVPSLSTRYILHLFNNPFVGIHFMVSSLESNSKQMKWDVFLPFVRMQDGVFYLFHLNLYFAKMVENVFTLETENR